MLEWFKEFQNKFMKPVKPQDMFNTIVEESQVNMRLRSVTVEGFRCFKEKSVKIELGKVTAIAGPNDSGKTSFLLALAGGLSVLDNVQNSSNPFYWLHQQILGSWATAGQNQDANPGTVGAEFAQANCKTLWLNVPLSTLKERNGKVLSSDDVKRFCKEEEEGNGELCATWASGSRRAAYFLPSQRVSTNMSISGDMDAERARQTQLNENPQFLLDYVKAITDNHERNEREYQPFLDSVRQFFPGLQGIDVRSSVNPPRDVFLQKSDGKWYPLSHCGSGITNVLYFAGRLMQIPEEPLVIILFDEPETDLHPALQRRLMAFIHTLTKQRPNFQWILATHSPFILSSLDSDDKLVVFSQEGDRPITAAAEIPLENVWEAYNALGMYLPEFLSAKVVVGVEGPSDGAFYRKALEKAGVEPGELADWFFLPLGGDAMEHIPPRELKRLHPRIAVTIDKERNTASARIRRDFKAKCDEEGIPCFIDPTNPWLEKTFPPRAVEAWEQLAKERHLPVNKSKKDYAERVAEQLTESEARGLPVVFQLREWYDQTKERNPPSKEVIA